MSTIKILEIQLLHFLINWMTILPLVNVVHRIDNDQELENESY